MMKYYTLSKIISVIFLIGLFISPADATLLTSSTSPTKIFKCSPSTISATFDDAGIIGVNAIVSSEVGVIPDWSHNNPNPTTQTTIVSMTYNGSYWVGTFGNDSTLLWGNRVISYQVNTGIINTYGSTSKIFVYSDVCTGSGITNYTQVSSGLGKYTSMLYIGQYDILGTSFETSLVGWALLPWLMVWGNIFYFVIIFIVTTTLYLKTQNIVQPLVIGIFFLMLFAASSYVPWIYRRYILFFIALGISALYYRVFVKD